MKVALKKKTAPPGFGGIPWTAAEPFVENTCAHFTHRVKHVTTHKISDRWPSHLAVNYWCGNGSTGTSKFTFISAPGESHLVCARCEAQAVAAGLPTSDALAGRHVHLGKLVAVRDCPCDAEPALMPEAP